MKIGIVQYSPLVGDKKANLEKIRHLLQNQDADIFILPEMGTTGYPTKSKEELFGCAENLQGNLIKDLTAIARDFDTCLMVGMPELFNDRVYNTTVVVGPEGIIATHQKTHLFMEEKHLFSPGTTEPKVFEWKGVKIGLGVCYDYMFPEFWRKLALDGAELFCNTANFVYDYGFRVMQVRSIENGVFSVTVNRTGQDAGVTYKGGSEIVDNTGKVLFKASPDQEEVKILELDLQKSNNKQWNPLNNLFEDRREDMYI